MCFCVCFCHTHELHPVLIKTGWSFYVIMECGACFQQILLLSLLFAASQSSSRHIHHPAIPSYCSPSLCNLLHAFLLLPFPPLLLYFAHTFTPHPAPHKHSLHCKRCVHLISIPLISAVLTPMFVCLLHLLIFSLPPPLPIFDFISLFFSIFSLTCCFCLSLPPVGDHVAGWDGVRQGESG